MGCGGSKPDEGATPPGDGLDVEGNEKVRTFRERRLSMSQQQEGNGSRRRLSIYGTSLGEDAQPSQVESPCPSCGCKTVGGLEPVPGGTEAKINQDRGLAIYPWKEDPKCGLFGVYDGHGKVGQKVSEFVIQNLPQALKANEELFDKDPGDALQKAYVKVDEDLAAEPNVDASVAGTTAVTCFIKENHLWLANSGDSRAIIVRKTPSGPGLKAIDLTVDQKPDTPAEMKRILQMGGHVTPASANGSPSRVWHNLRGLAMARSIGDHAAATVGVIAEPEITEYDLVEDDYCLVIASDGVWEFLDSQTVADLIAGVKKKAKNGDADVQVIVDTIVDQSSYMWKIEEGDYRDDITVIVLMLPWIPLAPPAAAPSAAAASDSEA